MRIWQRLGVVGLMATLIMGVVAPNATLAAPPLPDIQIEISHVLVDLDPTFDPDVPPPEPGSAEAFAKWQTPQWVTIWKCTYAGWARRQVYWSCRLEDKYDGQLINQYSGTFSAGYHNPGPWTSSRSTLGICVEAHAHYTAYVQQQANHRYCG